MARFIKINNNLRCTVPNEEYKDGDIYIDLEKIIYVQQIKEYIDGPALKIQLVGEQRFLFNYDDTNPVWEPLLSWLNK